MLIFVQQIEANVWHYEENQRYKSQYSEQSLLFIVDDVLVCCVDEYGVIGSIIDCIIDVCNIKKWNIRFSCNVLLIRGQNSYVCSWIIGKC